MNVAVYRLVGSAGRAVCGHGDDEGARDRPIPEIGAELFLRARTVEWHLRNIFRKLAISSRHELDGALTSRSRIAAATPEP
jgi:hypothetical protein